MTDYFYDDPAAVPTPRQDPGMTAADASILAGPTPPAQLPKASIIAVQSWLNALGYGVGAVDGLWGRKSQAAFTRFAYTHGLQANTIDATLLARATAGETAGFKTGPTLNTGTSVWDTFGDGGGATPLAASGGVPGGAPAATPPAGSGFGDGTLSTDEVQRIKELYPSLAHLLDEPEIYNLLVQATKDNGWPPEKLTLALEGTRWFQTTTASQRSWDQSLARDPSTVESNIAKKIVDLENLMSMYGIRGDAGTVREFAIDILRDGLNPTQELRMLGNLARSQLFEKTGNANTDATAGLASLVQGLTAMARQYHLSFPSDRLEEWAVQIVEGRFSKEAAESLMRSQARTYYPTLAKEIDAGFTIEDYFAPTKAKLSSLLEVNPNEIDFTDAKWSRFTQMVTDKGDIRPMTFSELATEARQMDDWWGTAEASETTYGTLNSMLKTFGAIA